MSRRGPNPAQAGRRWRRPAALLLSAGLLAFTAAVPADFVPFVRPAGWPKPAYELRRNPQTPAGFALGRALFYDPILSRDYSTSCASCHSPATAFTHADHRTSHGVEGRIGRRNAPTLQNLAWTPAFHWDGGVNNLEVQAVNPLTHPSEMDFTLDGALARLRAAPAYRARFAQAFGDSAVTGQRLLKALAQFTVSLQSYNSRYDQVMRHEPGAAFSEPELQGLALFRQHCASCHQEPLFTTNGFANNGLAPDPYLRDPGRAGITLQPADSFQFRIPTLRNIEFSGPYMHDGRFRTLGQVLRHYTAGGIRASATLAPQLRQPPAFTAAEQRALLLFLFTLTDKQFLQDPRLNYVPEAAAAPAAGP
ncbi:cytochrome c peroxidase [Hymenobacter daecheongensis DSM 21074]|uniref:Cytochrome c peroxidase n=1 Tax=Hymenobacter daecheongensis DSM 21074 TaxID=1121955 RepID=A0A1M6A8Y9_9BACT|nr:cytochrome c peroxidase [Hymenobacter daecheongensis]SHI32886.1 cytochrome c peroxidase [Hymenobacter daecheongensis DSM 21074]